MADLSKVSPQQTFLVSQPEKPSATSTLYINRFTTKNNDQTENHTVIGVHIVLAPNDPNGIWKALHVDRAKQTLDPQNPRVATKSLQIYCDTLEVRGEFSLPEAEVVVYARRINWATADAAINTSPLPWALDKAKNAEGNTAGQNGAHGRNAGSLKIFAGKVEPMGDTRPRLAATGGNGQHPGSGRDGSNGKSMQHWTQQVFNISRKGEGNSKCTVDFNPAAVYIDYGWVWGVVPVGSNTKGDNSFPENGTNAVGAGVPGDAGDGGGLTTNLEALKRCFTNAGGTAGDKQRDYSGGAAGDPTSAGKYKLKMYYNVFGTDNADKSLVKTDSRNTTKGADAKSQGPRKARGDTPKPVVSPASNAWLHPLAVQKALEYARDLFLGGERVETEAMLADYDAALALDPPTGGAWETDSAHWMAAQSEVASMLARLRGHLDYFGNAAGYTPLLSLPSTVKLYGDETQRAMRLILLAGWIEAKQREAKEASDILNDAIGAANDDAEQAAARVVAAEAKIDSVTSSIESITQELNKLGNDLGTLRSSLMSKAKNDLQRKAQIRFGIKIAATICQIIPVGQPVLGTIGKLGDVAASFVGGKDEDTPDTISKMGGVMTKAADAASKAKKAKEKAKEKAKKKPPKDKDEAKKESIEWSKVGKGLGTAVSGVAGAMKELQVSEDEVEAELQKLESDSPEWKALVKRIRDLNQRKAEFAADLMEALQAVSEGYGRIASAAAAIFSMQQERARQIGKVDLEATGFVREMGQRARLTLLKYLYLMVKSYETTVFNNIHVDWKLTEIADKINTLITPEGGLDAAKLDAHIKILAPIYQKNLNTIRTQLLDDFKINEKTLTLQFGLDRTQTADIIEGLNQTGEAVIDPVAYGLLLPDRQLVRLSSVKLDKLEFDPDGPQLPDTHNVVITLQPAHTGTMRKGQQLYSVYSDEPLNWSWTMTNGKVTPDKPSQASQDVLDLILGKGAGEIRQKVALPPVWSDWTVSVLFSPDFPAGKSPRLVRLYFLMECDASPAPSNHRVLRVRTLGTTPGAVISCTPDLAKRGDGFDNVIRIYDKGANVKLGVPEQAGGAIFDSWDIVSRQNSETGVKKREVSVKLDDHVLAQCHWARARVADETIVSEIEIKPKALKKYMSTQDGISKRERAQLASLLESTDAGEASAEPDAPRDLPIRVEPTVRATVIGVAPALEEAEVLEDGKRWKLVNYRGVVGWVDADGR
ncbi:MAG TPA: SH3 domain-containing protein [Chthoniobacterales bacterium]|nr:SH3 domain-containing protein [Chthoniobacterales bacterium]